MFDDRAAAAARVQQPSRLQRVLATTGGQVLQVPGSADKGNHGLNDIFANGQPVYPHWELAVDTPTIERINYSINRLDMQVGNLISKTEVNRERTYANNERLDQHEASGNQHKQIIDLMQSRLYEMARMLASKDPAFAGYFATLGQDPVASSVPRPSAPFPLSPPQQSAPAPQQKIGLGGVVQSNFTPPPQTPEQIAREQAHKAKKEDMRARVEAARAQAAAPAPPPLNNAMSLDPPGFMQAGMGWGAMSK